MERDYWFTSARGFAGLESRNRWAASPPARAAPLERREIGHAKVPVIFEPRTARSLLDNLFDAVHGMPIYRNESFLAGKLGQKVAGEGVTVIDDGTLPGLFGTSPFDDEGRALTAHGGHRARHAEELPAEHLCGAEAGDENHRQRIARPHRECRDRPRELLSGEGRPNAGANHRRHSRRVLCDRTHGFWREHRDRRLFARRGRPLDPQRRAGFCGLRSYHRRKPAGHAHGIEAVGAIWSSAAPWLRPRSRLER